MILNRQNLSENNWKHFKIVPQGHNNCQLSIVNCQFGEAAKCPFISMRTKQPIGETSEIRGMRFEALFRN